ncbi:MAG: hypothetical protein QXI42_09670 [Thermoproteota archaeon]|nr:hypothetical protein [Candidatus Brockarchaeota archaeon]
MGSSGIEREDLAKKLAKKLKERSGYEFILDLISKPPFHWVCKRKETEYPVKSPDGKKFGLIFRNANLRSIYFDSKRLIKWPDDWIDQYPPFIDGVRFVSDFIEVRKGMDMDLDFISEAYYSVKFGHFLVSSILESIDTAAIVFSNREDRMKVARFIPSVIKDFNVFLRLLDEACTKYGISRSEVYVYPSHFDCWMRFKIDGMSDEEVVENTLVRVEALKEFRGKFREWLPNERRREYYENTILFPEDPFRRRFRMPDVVDRDSGFSLRKYEGIRYLYKWPSCIGNPEVERKYESSVKHELWSSLSGKYYDLEGYRLRLAKKTERGLRFLGKVNRKGWVIIDKAKVREEDLNREDIVIAVDERLEKLPKFPLEKIEFLKEDFPEMFKE